MLELIVCRSCVPASASSIGFTIASRITDVEAPGYETLMLIVGFETFGNCCCTSVVAASAPASSIRASRTKTRVGRRTKSVVNHMEVLLLRDLALRLNRLPVGDPELSVRDDRLARREPVDDRVLPVLRQRDDVHGLRD